MAYGWFVSACLSLSYCSHIHMYTAEAGRAGLRTAWHCFALPISNCLTTSSYSLYSNPTLHVFLKCFPLSSLKAKHAWSPVEGGKWPIHLPWKGATVNLYQSVNQAGTVGMNPRVLSPCLLLHSESGSRAVFQLPRCVWLDGRMREWWKPLSDVKWAASGKEGASYSERISCKSTQKHKTVEVSVSGAGELLVRLTPKST